MLSPLLPDALCPSQQLHRADAITPFTDEDSECPEVMGLLQGVSSAQSKRVEGVVKQTACFLLCFSEALLVRTMFKPLCCQAWEYMVFLLTQTVGGGGGCSGTCSLPSSVPGWAWPGPGPPPPCAGFLSLTRAERFAANGQAWLLSHSAAQETRCLPCPAGPLHASSHTAGLAGRMTCGKTQGLAWVPWRSSGVCSSRLCDCALSWDLWALGPRSAPP